MVSDMRICFDNDGNAYIAEEPYGVIECQTKEDFERANEAIKKSIPKKPEIIACDEKKRYHCSCGKTLFIEYTGGGCHGNKAKYCDKCGQAIDWEEGEADA